MAITSVLYNECFRRRCVTKKCNAAQVEFYNNRRGQRGWYIRELCFNSKSTFYPCTVFRQPHPLPEGALNCRWSAADCVVYCRTGGVTGDNSIVYDFYPLAAKSTVYAKIALIKSLMWTQRRPATARSRTRDLLIHKSSVYS